MKRVGVGAVLVALVVAGLAWWRCGAAPEAPRTRGVVVERVVPRGAVAVALTASLAKSGGKLRVLQSLKVTGFLAQLQGFADGDALADALVKELGVDVRSEATLAEAGLDGARGAAVFVLLDGRPVLALPLADAERFNGTLARLAGRRLGASVMQQKQGSGASATTFACPTCAVPALAWVPSNTYALVGDGKLVDQLLALAAMTESDALVQDRDYLVRLRELPREVWVPTGSPALLQGPLQSVLVSATLTAAGVDLDGVGAWKDDGTKFAALVPQADAVDTLGYLPRDAFLVARFNGDPSKLDAWKRQLLGSGLTRVFFDWRFDLKTQLFDQLKPGSAMSLSLSEAPPLGAGMPDLDIRRTNPFAYAQLAGVTPVKSGDAVWPALEQLQGIAPKFGAQMEVRTRDDGQKALLTTWAQGEGVHFAPRGELVFFGSPVRRLGELVAGDGKAGSPVAGLPDDALAVALDFQKLAASVRALPDSTWGLGGFAMKTAASRWLDATDDLKGLTLQAGVRDGRVRFRVQVKLGSP